jgi:hypothetical protein
MRTILLAGAASLLSVSLAFAQTAGTSGQTSTVATAETGSPAKGANSFTQSQAVSRIAEAGFRDVNGLKKDSDGVWRGVATRNGQQVSVWLDYTGKVGQS